MLARASLRVSISCWRRIPHWIFVAAKRRANHMNVWKACSLVLLCAGVTDARTVAENPSFMMVSGITATEEMCLTVADGTCLCIGRVCALVGDSCFHTFPGNVGIDGADVSWNRAALPQQRVMAASCGNFPSSVHLQTGCPIL